MAQALFVALGLFVAWSPPAAATPAASPGQRIVALAPSVVETLFELGLGDRLVGVGDFCHWPPEVAALPRLGGLVDPHIEEILALQPDLAIVLPSEQELVGRLARLGAIELLTVRSETLQDVADAAQAIAEAAGRPLAGEAFADTWWQRLAPRARSPAPTVLLAVGRQPGGLARIMTAGPGTFLDELLTRLGARNVFADAPVRYPQVGLEEILARDPDQVIEIQWRPLDPAAEAALLAEWQALPGLRAVAADRLSVVDGYHTVVPGPRLLRLYDELDAALTP